MVGLDVADTGDNLRQFRQALPRLVTADTPVRVMLMGWRQFRQVLSRLVTL